MSYDVNKINGDYNGYSAAEVLSVAHGYSTLLETGTIHVLKAAADLAGQSALSHGTVDQPFELLGRGHIRPAFSSEQSQATTNL